jgi:hypothetical protein
MVAIDLLNKFAGVVCKFHGDLPFFVFLNFSKKRDIS